jgi:hypothetical protein
VDEVAKPGAAPRARTLGDEQFIEALRAPGCPLCTHADRRVRRHLAGVLYELVTDIGYRERLVASGGFCSRHTRLAVTVNREDLGGATAAAILLRSVLAARRRALADAGTGRRAAGRIGDATRGAWSCGACEQEGLAVRDAVAGLIGHAGHDASWRQWLLAPPWCLEHIGQLATAANTVAGDVAAAFMKAQLERLSELDGRLDGLVHHSAHDRLTLLTDREHASAGEAESIIAGTRRP